MLGALEQQGMLLSCNQELLRSAGTAWILRSLNSGSARHLTMKAGLTGPREPGPCAASVTTRCAIAAAPTLEVKELSFSVQPEKVLGHQRRVQRR